MISYCKSVGLDFPNPSLPFEGDPVSDPLRTAGDVLRTLALYANAFGTAGTDFQARKRELATILRGAAVGAPEHNLYGKRFAERLAALIEEV